MMATGFLGYVLPYGQMSLWGNNLLFMPGAAIPLRIKPDKNFRVNLCLHQLSV
jgi:hypothetical protein